MSYAGQHCSRHMQAVQLQRLQQELAEVRENLQPLQQRQREELTKDEPNETKLGRLEAAIAPLAGTEQKLLDERRVLEAQAGGEQWGPVPDVQWQALRVSRSIMRSVLCCEASLARGSTCLISMHRSCGCHQGCMEELGQGTAWLCMQKQHFMSHWLHSQPSGSSCQQWR